MERQQGLSGEAKVRPHSISRLPANCQAGGAQEQGQRGEPQCSQETQLPKDKHVTMPWEILGFPQQTLNPVRPDTQPPTAEHLIIQGGTLGYPQGILSPPHGTLGYPWRAIWSSMVDTDPLTGDTQVHTDRLRTILLRRESHFYMKSNKDKHICMASSCYIFVQIGTSYLFITMDLPVILTDWPLTE